MNVSPAQGVAYGVIQGLTEFLPISSSAHLFLLPWFSGWPDPGLTFTVSLHAGTLLAILWYFWREWWALGAGIVASLRDGRAVGNGEARLFWKLLVGSVPAVLAGLALEDAAETSFRSPLLIAATLAGLGGVLYWSDRRPESRRGTDAIGWRDAFLIGVAQATAIVPGVSRSGATITLARCLAIDRETSARFSFLLSGPIIAGAVVFEARSLSEIPLDAGHALALIASAAAGFAAIRLLLQYVRFGSYTPFVLYRMVLAGVILLVAF